MCVDCYSCSGISELQVRVSIGFYKVFWGDFNVWICKIIVFELCLLGMLLQPFQNSAYSKTCP